HGSEAPRNKKGPPRGGPSGTAGGSGRRRRGAELVDGLDQELGLALLGAGGGVGGAREDAGVEARSGHAAVVLAELAEHVEGLGGGVVDGGGELGDVADAGVRTRRRALGVDVLAAQLGLPAVVDGIGAVQGQAGESVAAGGAGE